MNAIYIQLYIYIYHKFIKYVRTRKFNIIKVNYFEIYLKKSLSNNLIEIMNIILKIYSLYI